MKKIILTCAVLALTGAAVAQDAHAPSGASQTVTSEELKSIRELVDAQAAEIRQLRNDLQQMQESRTAAPAPAADQQQAITELQNDVADIKTTMTNTALTSQEEQKRVSNIEGILGRFRFNGDVRVRYENFFQGVPLFEPRHRERIRARFGVEGKLTEDFTGGIYLATGELIDPTSTNETLTNAFQRKTIGVDRGWITFQPRNAKWLQLTGGKYAFTWIRTPNTFDNDLNPEGFSQKLSFDINNNVLRNVSLTGMQLFFLESSGGADSFAVGGQLATKLQLGKRITMTPSISALNWRNENVLVANSSIPGSSGGAFARNGMTNATLGVAPNRTFASGFLYLDAILDTTIKTGWDRFPVRLLLEYEENLEAASNKSHLYLGDISVGRLKEKHDVTVGYGLWRQEQDSVIASFVESDQRAPTNVFQHRLFAQYLVRKNTTLAYTFWFGRTLDTNLQNAALGPGVVAGTKEPLLRRMQLDAVYKF